MALKDNIVAAIACPACGAVPPHNFTVEHRVTIRESKDGKSSTPRKTVADAKPVIVCSNCGEILKLDG